MSNVDTANIEVTTLEDVIVEKLRKLPEEKQMQVRDFVEFLHSRALPTQPRQSIKGIAKHLIDKPVTEEEIYEARKEMWGEYMGEENAA